jgi:hypothetical protein
MFERWHDFYLLVGSAAGALIGLLFVVATLTAGFSPERGRRGVAFFMTPTLFHLGVILALSAMAMAPDLDGRATGGLVAASALAGAAFCVYAIAGIRSAGQADHWSDVWCYGAAPLAAYAALGVIAAAFWMGSVAAPALAAVLMALLAIAIRNAWDLVTWMAPRASHDEKS